MTSLRDTFVPLSEARGHEVLGVGDTAPAGVKPKLSPRVDVFVAQTYEQLRQGRELADKACKLAEATQEQASNAEALAREGEHLVDAARTMLDRVGALAND